MDILFIYKGLKKEEEERKAKEGTKRKGAHIGQILTDVSVFLYLYDS